MSEKMPPKTTSEPDCPECGIPDCDHADTCCCGDAMKNHSSALNCGHAPKSMKAYALELEKEAADSEAAYHREQIAQVEKNRDQWKKSSDAWEKADIERHEQVLVLQRDLNEARAEAARMREGLEEIAIKSRDNWACARAETALGRGKIVVLPEELEALSPASGAALEGREDG